MKEHNIFATVFLILVLGFLSFNTVGLTGQVYEEYSNWGGERYDGPVLTTNTVSARNLKGVNLVSNFGQKSYSSSWDNPVNEISLSKNFAAVSSDQRNYRTLELNNEDYEGLNIADLRLCIGHITRFENQVALENAEFYVGQAGMQDKCLPVEMLDVNGDGFVSITDEKFAQAYLRGENTKSVWGKHSNQIPCDCKSEGISKHFNMKGGWKTCTFIDEATPYKNQCFWI